MTGNVVPNVCCLEAPSHIRPDCCGKAFRATLPSRSQSNRNYRMLVHLSYFHADHMIEKFPPDQQNRMFWGFFLIADVLMLLDVLLGKLEVNKREREGKPEGSSSQSVKLHMHFQNPDM